MSNAKKLSEINITDVANYIRLEELTASDMQLLTSILEASKAFILKYTGLSLIEADNYNDIVIALYVLCEDMYDTRAMYVDNSNVNKVVEAILGLHSVNLL